jgi:membrane associated rhomboid family serine protease
MIPAGTGVELGPDTTCVMGNPSWFSPLTSMFMHGSWMHIIGNMWFLWIFGNNVEDSMGHLRFIVFYVLCGLAAAALQTAMQPSSPVPMVGASGAIGGVMGAYILLYPRVKVHTLLFLGFYINTFAIPALFMLGYWFAMQLVSGVLSVGAEGGGVAFWAHVGGFVAGALLVLLFRNPRLLERHPYYGWKRPSPTQPYHLLRK